MIISLKYFTQEIRNEYNIEDITDNGYICVEIRKGVYGLNVAGILEFNHVVHN